MRGDFFLQGLTESMHPDRTTRSGLTYLSLLTDSVRHLSASFTHRSISKGHLHSPSMRRSCAEAPERSIPTKLFPAPLSCARLLLSI